MQRMKRCVILLVLGKALSKICVCKRQMISSLMLKHGRSYPGKKTWGARHQRWLQQQKFDDPGHQIALRGMVAQKQKENILVHERS